MSILDRRLYACRTDLADERLRGKVAADRFATGRPMRVVSPVLDLRNAPRPDANLDTQLIHGDDVLVFEEREGWAWLQSERDGYVGYASSASLGERAGQATHVVVAPRTFTYRDADMKTAATGAHAMGSRLTIVGNGETRDTRYALLETGEALVEAHLWPVGELAPDYVSVAEQLERTPYLWGGTTAFGIDCSGLVQRSLRMGGKDVLRDTDMQATSIGETIDPGDSFTGLRRGDLVFWKGHVAIMLDGESIIHANGHTMMVSREPLSAAVERISYLYGMPTGYRRP